MDITFYCIFYGTNYFYIKLGFKLRPTTTVEQFNMYSELNLPMCKKSN